MKIEDAQRALGVTDQTKKSTRRVIAVHRTKRGHTFFTHNAKASFVTDRALPLVENR